MVTVEDCKEEIERIEKRYSARNGNVIPTIETNRR